MKKLTALLMIVCMSLFVVGCGGAADDAEHAGEATPSSTDGTDDSEGGTETDPAGSGTSEGDADAGNGEDAADPEGDSGN